MNYNHFKISLAFGLYYEGLIFSINHNIKTDYITESQNNIVLGPNESHIPISLNKLSEGFIPYPLNFINYKIGIINNIETTNYYNLIDKPLMIPTFHFYFMTIITKINYYQSILEKLLIQFKIIINNLLVGKTKDMEKIFTQYYPSIICLNKIIEKFKSSYIKNFDRYTSSKLITDIKLELIITPYDTLKLGELLNNINAYIYIYYYLYSPNNIIKLSKFNYYEITDNTDTKYLYYNKPNINDLIPIIYNESINHNNINNQISISIPTNIGNFNDFSILSNYIKDYTEESNFYIIKKEQSLPPSLFNHINDFYKFIIIDLIDKIFNKISNDIKIKIKDIYNNSDFYLCQIIEDLILNNINFIIKKTIIHKIKDLIIEIPETIEPNINDTFIVMESNLSIPLNTNPILINNNSESNNIIYTTNLSNIDLFKYKKKLYIDPQNI